VRAIVTGVAGSMVIMTAALGSHGTATADTYTDQIAAKQQQLNADGAAAAALNAELKAAGDQEDALRKVIADLDLQISTVEAQVSDAQVQLNSIETALSIAQDNLAYTQEKLAADKHQLAVEMVVMYKALNASNTFSNFLNSGDFNSFWQHVLDVHRLNASENKLVAAVTAEQQTIQADVDTISSKKVQQKALLDTLRGMVAQLNSQLAARRQAQAHLEAVQAYDRQKLAENEQAQKDLQAQIAKLKADEAAALAAGGGNGQFAWPETGPITQGFGCTTFVFEPWDPNCPTRHFHSGIDIAAPCGNNIAAADGGIVHTFWTEWGFGHYIIIVHGNGWVSVYGHMSSFAVGDGQAVHRGQLIGWEGSSGNSTGCHVHFEVDLNGVPQNPMHYLS
jgi:murein DD-endopeptidase MepM/ murein hydrolase activator NlpD